jgi:hypothetical protein
MYACMHVCMYAFCVHFEAKSKLIPVTVALDPQTDTGKPMK